MGCTQNDLNSNSSKYFTKFTEYRCIDSDSSLT